MRSACIYRLEKRVLAKASLIIHYLGAFAVEEATASLRRTQLAVVRRA
jgi:hypothetical protein